MDMFGLKYGRAGEYCNIFSYGKEKRYFSVDIFALFWFDALQDVLCQYYVSPRKHILVNEYSLGEKACGIFASIMFPHESRRHVASL
jgi:hypothetical protein